MARFSKVHYVAVAQVIDGTWRDSWRSIHDASATENGMRTEMVALAKLMGELVARFADLFEQDNDRFDRQRFVGACEGDAQDLWGLSA